MANKITEKIIIGSLMNNPLLLAESDKYFLTTDDFDALIHQYLFYAIYQVAAQGSTKIAVQDIDLFLNDSMGKGALFRENNGIELLHDAIELANQESFPVYYNILKKENLLRDLSHLGFDTSKFYEKNPLTDEKIKVNDNYLELSNADIIEEIKRDIFELEGSYIQGSATEEQDAFQGLEELLSDLEENPDIGMPLAGDIFNAVCGGARLGTLYVRSAPSGLGKTRLAMGDACQLAFPIRYNAKTLRWEQTGFNEKVLVVITEQVFREVQLMMLAYLTDMNERKIKRKHLRSSLEDEVLLQAVQVVEHFKDNFRFVQMPSPTLEGVKSTLRREVLLHNIQYVFYDYIFISPSIIREFQGVNLRNDEVLLMLATALKEIAVELNIFIMTSTQVNHNIENNKEIRNESSIAGSKAIINKADFGCMMARPTQEELKTLENLIVETGIEEPNTVTDVYKNRGDQWTQLRIWSTLDLGTMKRKDHFVTDSRLIALDNFSIDNYHFPVDYSVVGDLLEKLNRKE